MKQIQTALLFIVCIYLIGGCVPREKLIYLQPSQVAMPEKTFTYEDKEYALKPKDVISLNIFSLTPGQFNFFSGPPEGEGGEGKSNNQFVIDREGMVELPAIGKVKVAGYTIQEAQDTISDLLEDYLKSPLVRITLQTPFIFSVLGEANNPGRYVIIGREMNIMEAIAHAGDLSTYADRSNVRLMRKDQGVLTVHRVDLLDDELINTELYQLQSEDILVVDPLPARSFRENQLFVISSVLGAVGGIAVLIRLLM
ncbi:polysaccharide export outer membrane protein [Catalinimonas alkaloidigena]|uniref:polysaccharide biosynthesis/export family protein n=1 Tax=Catalinimonas alkaloidigena TaxID=1075417 RepID=UPI0024075219|nr:polysaccharide biosynthesis/export family protein [Catalinimonas alkaloidigena]MDF9798368.1 polysaccharide export outer membrane protein [Catalinimonas alkaloidigena]